MFNTEKFNNREAFMEFLLSKGDEIYNYFDNGNCCFAQWAKECLTDSPLHVSATGFHILLKDDAGKVVELHELPDDFEASRPVFTSTFAQFHVNMVNNKRDWG